MRSRGIIEHRTPTRPIMPRSDPARALLGLPKHGSGLGLHRMLHAIDALELDWTLGLDAIKVTGSNGKGSVCAMVAGILEAVGVRVGLYTSPHLQRFHERIVVDGQPITEVELVESHAWFEELRAAYAELHPGDAYGAFEAMTAVALHRFGRARVDTVVAEAGIGGRYDATRAIPGQVCGLVSVDLEHTGLLGTTEEAIAFDKADLCPPGGTLTVGALGPELLRRLEAYCRLREVQLHRIEARAEAVVRAESLRGTTVDLQVDDLTLGGLQIPTPGRHQVHNASLAIALAYSWLRLHRPELALPCPTADSPLVVGIHEAFARLHLPGRLELVQADPPVVIDVGHTPAAMTRVADTLTRLLGPARVILVMGVSHDREPEALLTPLVPLASHVICTRAHHRGGDPARLEAVLTRRWPTLPCIVEPTVETATERAQALARAHGEMVVVAGGLFLAMEAAAALRGEDPAALEWP